MKIILAIWLCIQGIGALAQREQYVFHKKLSTWETDVIGMEGLNLRVAFNPNEKTILAAGDGGALVIWDIETGTILNDITKYNEMQIYDVTYSPDGKYFVTVGSQKHHKAFTIWESEQLRPIKTILYDTIRPFYKHYDSSIVSRNILSVIFSKDGKHLITGDDDGYLNSWEVGSWQLVSSIETHDRQIWEVNTDKMGQYVASCAKGGFVKIWTLEEGHLKFYKAMKIINHDTFTESTSISISPALLISTNNADTLKIIDMRTGIPRTIHSIKGNHNCIHGGIL